MLKIGALFLLKKKSLDTQKKFVRSMLYSEIQNLKIFVHGYLFINLKNIKFE